MDYEKHFDLTDNPFKNASEGRFYYKNASVQTALEIIAAADCPPIVHLKGAAKVGKTSLLRRMASELRIEFKVILLLNPNLKLPEILRQALTDFGYSHKFTPDTPEEELIGYFQNDVSDFIEEGFRILLVVDNAADLSPQALADLYELMKMEWDWEDKFILLLCGQEDAPWPMVPDILTELKEIHLAPLNATETEAYLMTRFRAAGGLKMCFSRGALKAVWEQSRGLPENINHLAERAMIAAWSTNRKEVAPMHVTAAKHSLDNPLPINTEFLDERPSATVRRHQQKAKPPSAKPLAAIILLAVAAVTGFWTLINKSGEAPQEPSVLAAPSVPETGPAEPPETATPAWNNSAAGSNDVLAPSLPTPPPQLLRLPQGNFALVVDLDKQTGMLWQNGAKGVGYKAEIMMPLFKTPGLFLLGRPEGKVPMIFQFPPMGEAPSDAARELWPEVSTLLPQNILPVIAANTKTYHQPANTELEELISNKVKAWVQAQQYRFPDTMAALYASSFQFFEVGQPPKMINREDFRMALASEAKTSGEVKLAISQPFIIQNPNNSRMVWAIFNLKYESKLRRDMGARVLVFEKSSLWQGQDNWLIVAELWLPEKPLQDN